MSYFLFLLLFYLSQSFAPTRDIALIFSMLMHLLAWLGITATVLDGMPGI